ncbi:hypothetical protein ACLB1O_09830 [Escherichia coli]
MLISHNVSVIRDMSNRVAVMYRAGIWSWGTTGANGSGTSMQLCWITPPAIDGPAGGRMGHIMQTDLPGNSQRVSAARLFFLQTLPLATHRM